MRTGYKIKIIKKNKKKQKINKQNDRIERTRPLWDDILHTLIFIAHAFHTLKQYNII